MADALSQLDTRELRMSDYPAGATTATWKERARHRFLEKPHYAIIRSKHRLPSQTAGRKQHSSAAMKPNRFCSIQGATVAHGIDGCL